MIVMNKQYHLWVDTDYKAVALETVNFAGCVTLQGWEEVDTLISELEEAAKDLWGVRGKDL